MALGLRREMAALTRSWRQEGHDLDFGVGVALGFATLGEIGFRGRFDYGVIGSLVDLASRPCDQARGGAEILISQRAQAAGQNAISCEQLPDAILKGFARPQRVYRVVGEKDATGLRIEVYPEQQAKQVADIVGTDFFGRLRSQVNELRHIVDRD